MKKLYESLLDNENTLLDKTDIKSKIEQWLEKYKDPYKIINYKINNDNTIDCERITIDESYKHRNKFISEFKFEGFPDYIRFNKVKFFEIDNPVFFKDENCQGFPKECYYMTLKSLRFKHLNIPTEKITGVLKICYCSQLESINTKLNSLDDLILNELYELKSLQNIVKNDINMITLRRLSSLTSLNGLPDKIGYLDIIDCYKLWDLKGCPRKIKTFHTIGFSVDKEFADGLRKINNIKD